MKIFDRAIAKTRKILQIFPNLSKSNTEFYIALIESELKHDLPLRVKDIIRTYPPETMCRTRRKVIKSTQQQLEKQEDFRALARDKTI
jgi:hypothetical protein